MAKANLTAPYVKVFDAVRIVTRVNPKEEVVFLDGENDPIGLSIQKGWKLRFLSDGTGGNDKQMMLQITDRKDIDDMIYAAERFDIGDTRYERVGNPSSPAGNPAIWLILLKPITRRGTLLSGLELINGTVLELIQGGTLGLIVET